MTTNSEDPERDEGLMGGDDTTESMVYDGDVYAALVRGKNTADARVAAASLRREPEPEDDDRVWPFVR